MEPFETEAIGSNPWVHEFNRGPELERARRSGGGSPPPPLQADACEVALVDVDLDDVEESDYFTLIGDVPVAGTGVVVRFQFKPGRILVETRADRIAVGYLPMKYLGLRRCTEQGWLYAGRITASAADAMPAVRVNLTPIRLPVE